MKSILTVLCCFLFNVVHAQKDSVGFTNNIPVNADSVYEKPDVEAQFPGGEKKWNKFIQDEIGNNLDMLLRDEKSNGTCLIKFIIDKDGKVSAAKVMTMEGSELAKVFMKAVLKGPQWIPAKVNDVNVKSIRMQKVTFRMPQKN